MSQNNQSYFHEKSAVRSRINSKELSPDHLTKEPIEEEKNKVTVFRWAIVAVYFGTKLPFFDIKLPLMKVTVLSIKLI